MGVFNFGADDTAGCAWLLDTFQRQFQPEPIGHFSFSGSSERSFIKTEVDCPREEYLTKLNGLIERMLDGEQVTRPLNQELTQLIKFPAVQGQLLKSVPQDVMDIYWGLNQQAFFMKQIAMNNFLNIEPHRFLTNPSSELKQYLFSGDAARPKTNNDASRRSRVKKKISTELMLESFECDKVESAQLDEEEQQLHLVIAVLEDLVYEQSGNARLITYYRDLACLS